MGRPWCSIVAHPNLCENSQEPAIGQRYGLDDTLFRFIEQVMVVTPVDEQ
ncbi:MAG: hypothetical protein ACLFVO_04580 [Chloroflexaceae bacterium]